jgi:hypothetical protein
MFAISAWVDRGVDAAMTGKLGPSITTHQIVGVALSVWAMHPVTWVLGYFVFEGAVRLCSAAFADSVFGTLPLFVADKVLFGMFRSGSRDGSDAKEGSAGNIASYLARSESGWRRLAFKSCRTSYFSRLTVSLRRSWRYAPAGRNQIGVRREWCVSRTATIDWRDLRSEVDRDPSDTCFGGWQRACRGVLFCSILRTTRLPDRKRGASAL